jgi:hypothetical protein
VLARRGDLSWERDIFEAACDPRPAEGDALLTEPLGDLDWRVLRWDRVPRVCASIATSAGFLFATIAVVRGLSIPSDPEWAPAVREALDAALTALTIGIAGTAFCATIHLRTRRLPRTHLEAADRLVERVRSLCQARA